VETRIYILLSRIDVEFFLMILLQLHTVIINVEFLIILKEMENFSEYSWQHCNRIPSECVHLAP
jgi:hypothetical protein